MGIPLERLEGPVQAALRTYQEISNNSLTFDIENASQLILTPDKPNSARSDTAAMLNGEEIGRFYVIAFKPGDGTGSEVNYKLDQVAVDTRYPRATLVIPRNKTGVHSETHLTLVTHATDDAHAEPALFAGRYDLLGLASGMVTRIGHLGHLEIPELPGPKATYTVGYRGSERFGDPHAVYSGVKNLVQVCAFLAVSDAVNQSHPNILAGLKPQFPN